MPFRFQERVGDVVFMNPPFSGLPWQVLLRGIRPQYGAGGVKTPSKRRPKPRNAEKSYLVLVFDGIFTFFAITFK
jgi:hypothetical protein